MRSKLFLLPAGLLVAGLAACGSSSAEKASLPTRDAGAATVGVRVISPRSTLDGGLVKATGRLQARHEALLSAKASGPIAALRVDVGDRVTKGQILLQIDSAQARIQVDQAKAAQGMAQAGFDNATLELDRARLLRKSGGVAQAGLDRAEAGFKQAEAQLAQASAAVRAAERHLRDHTLVAPFAGVVTAKLKNVGEYVSNMPPSPVIGLTDVDQLEVVLPVPETVVATIQPGAEVQGVVNPSGRPFTAKVRVVGAVVDPMGRTVEVRADLVGERHAEMRPHAIVEVDFSQGEASEGLFLPSQAVQHDGDTRFVWVVREGKVSKQAVEAEMVSPGVLRVLGGLDADVELVGNAAAGLQDGMSVQVVR